jgi:chaperonin cofactor prefoldin
LKKFLILKKKNNFFLYNLLKIYILNMSESKDGKAFELYEIRKELMNIEYSLQIIQKNCSTLNINLKKSEIVQKEIEGLDPKYKVYDRCGRIFVLSNKDEILNKLSENKKQMIKELDGQNEKKKYLEKNLQEKSKAYVEVAKANK